VSPFNKQVPYTSPTHISRQTMRYMVLNRKPLPPSVDSRLLTPCRGGFRGDVTAIHSSEERRSLDSSCTR